MSACKQDFLAMVRENKVSNNKVSRHMNTLKTNCAYSWLHRLEIMKAWEQYWVRAQWHESWKEKRQVTGDLVTICVRVRNTVRQTEKVCGSGHWHLQICVKYALATSWFLDRSDVVTASSRHIIGSLPFSTCLRHRWKARSGAQGVFNPLFLSQMLEEFWIISASIHFYSPLPNPRESLLQI